MSVCPNVLIYSFNYRRLATLLSFEFKTIT